MLKSLHINNFILIENEEINFGPEFCVISGESGSGKSIILNALLILIERKKVTKEMLNADNKYIQIIGTFDITNNHNCINLLQNHDITSQNNELIIRKTIINISKTKIYINDIPVTSNILSEITANLIEMEGQHSRLDFFQQNKQRVLIDGYGNFLQELKNVQLTYQNWQELVEEYNKKQQEIKKLKAEEEYLQFAVKELNDLEPKENEEEEITEILQKYKISNKITTDIIKVINSLDNQSNIDIISSLIFAQNILIDIKNYQTNLNLSSANSEFSSIIESIDKIIPSINDVNHKLNSIKQSYELQDIDIESVEQRLFELKNLSRKYRCNIDELSNLKQNLQKQLALLENQDNYLQTLNNKIQETRAQYITYAEDLFEKRTKLSKILIKKVEQELSSLSMEDTIFEIKTTKLPETKWNQYGINDLEFLISTNKGVKLSSFKKIVSGGELSRFVLALKLSLNTKKIGQTIIFDEIDTGIGGKLSKQVGQRLLKLSKTQQIIIVTHQPQVAALSNHHLKVKKIKTSDKTYTKIEILDQKAKLQEIARMISGHIITEEAMKAAEKLIIN